VLYREMIESLEYDKNNPHRPRRELDNQLQVNSWRLPGGAYRQRRPVPTTPAWWRGDEDASQSFMQAMRVVSLK
jgi:hypothetical protein